MRRETILVALVIAAAGASPVEARRFFCAIDDAWMRLTVEGGFDDGAGMRLVNLRGVLAFKGSVLPHQAHGYWLSPQLLTHSWMDADMLKLRFHAVYPADDRDAPSTIMDLAMISESEDGKPMKGHYEMKVAEKAAAQLAPVSHEKAAMMEPLEHSGSVFCRYE